MSSLLDWHDAGVDIKVELATDGDLVLSPSVIDLGFATGGVGGAPIGWTTFVLGGADSVANYNFTTNQGTFSVSNRLSTLVVSAGIIGPTYAIVPNAIYQINVKVRSMEGKAQNAIRSVMLEAYNPSTGNWSLIASTSYGNAQQEWEDITIQLTEPISSTYIYWRLKLTGGPPSGTTSGFSYGVQFRNCVVNRFDSTTLPEPTWKDITCDVRTMTIRHGREKYTNRYDPGTLVLGLDNRSGNYVYHNVHPFGLRPGRQLRVSASYKGTTYPEFFGVIDTITQGYAIDGTVLAQFSCLDVTSILSPTTVASNGDSLNTNKRINALVNQANYPTNKRLIDAAVSGWPMQQIVSSGRTLRDEAGVTADSEGGSFFGDRSGNMVYKNRNWISTDPKVTTVQADLVAREHAGYGPMPIPDDVPTVANAPLICVSEFMTDWSMDRVINLVTLANRAVPNLGTGGTQTFTDDESFREHGPQTYQRLDFVQGNDNNLATRAADLMSNYTDPVLRVNRVMFKTGLQKQPDKTWPFTLAVFLNWMVRVWYVQPDFGWGFSVCTHVQSVEHQITPTDWTVVLVVDVPVGFTEYQYTDGTVGWDISKWDQDVWDAVES